MAVPRGFTYPLFVKPVREDASIGIDDNSVARDYESLVKKVKELKGTKVDQVGIGSCTNSSLADMMLCAKVLKGKKINKDTSTDTSGSK